MYACADRIGSPTSLVWLKCHLTYKQTTYWGWILPFGLKSLNKSTRPGSGSHPNSIGSDGQTLCRDWVSAIVSLNPWSLFKLSGHKFLWSLPFPELIFAFWISVVLWNFEVRWGSRVFGSVPDHTRPWEMNWKEWSFWELFKSTKQQQVCLSWTLGLQSVSRTQGTMFSQGKTWQHKTCPFLPSCAFGDSWFYSRRRTCSWCFGMYWHLPSPIRWFLPGRTFRWRRRPLPSPSRQLLEIQRCKLWPSWHQRCLKALISYIRSHFCRPSQSIQRNIPGYA